MSAVKCDLMSVDYSKVMKYQLNVVQNVNGCSMGPPSPPVTSLPCAQLTCVWVMPVTPYSTVKLQAFPAFGQE